MLILMRLEHVAPSAVFAKVDDVMSYALPDALYANSTVSVMRNLCVFCTAKRAVLCQPQGNGITTDDDVMCVALPSTMMLATYVVMRFVLPNATCAKCAIRNSCIHHHERHRACRKSYLSVCVRQMRDVLLTPTLPVQPKCV